ncbi:DsbA family oxidoreductase [Microbacterium hominis]|uniref:DsbA family oxidoreductase n=1 Tax=Microbacterium hominis TaxID=162426 RepID=UPI0019643F10|nr:DsbA family oxidoreductase [Microbacterium hominis]QRY39679.1 DsbA family oxidoreductase [Microbacterium hominis]
MSSRETNTAAPIVIEVWADLSCPWCYVGKHRLQRAIDSRADADRFQVKLRSFELNPNAPHTPETIESAFIRSHGGDANVVLQAERRIQALSQREGLPFSLDRLNANTFDFHRVVHYADEAGKGLEFFSRAQDRFFAGEINPFDAEVLAQVAAEVGLSADRVREVLESDQYADAVRADTREGQELGIQGVPFTVFDRRFAASGAQSVEAYGQVLDTLMADTSDTTAPADSVA